MRRLLFAILLAIAVCVLAPVHASNAASITVNTTADELDTDGDCSLREAVRAANGNVAVDACPAGQNDQTDTITVPAGTYTLTVAGNDDDASGGDLDLLNNAAAHDLVINGAGAATTIIEACDVDQRTTACPAGHGVADRVFHVRDADVAISGVTIRHGRAPRLNSILPGSGIYVQRAFTPAALTLTDVVVTRNGATVFDGLSVEGGGIKNEYGSHLTLTRVIVSENADNSGSGGAGIFNLGTNNDPGAPATLVMTDSTVRDNIGLLNSGSIRNRDGATATLTGCTLSGNTGGGFVNLSSSSTATLTNCTISGNVANGGGAGIANGGTLNLRSSTVTLNHRTIGPSGNGAGGIVGSGPTVLRNTIVAGNIDDQNQNVLSPDCDDNGAAVVISEGFSLVGDGTHCQGLVDGVHDDQIGTTGAAIDPKLGPLADNGGPTLTHALLEGSPAQDAGDPAAPGSGGTACPTTDQRGEARPTGLACDAGSVEVAGAAVLAIQTVKPGGGGNAGTVLARVRGSGFAQGAVARLVRQGSADIVGTTADVSGSQLTTSFDLVGATPGVWSVTVTNPDASTATLTDAFTVTAGGGPDLWSELVLPRSFIYGRTQTIYLEFGNRGNVDALAVPIWLSFPDELEFHVPFEVSPPPAQPGQVPVDWTRIAIDVPIPPPEDRDSFPLLLPIVPAGSTGVLKFRVKSPPPKETCQGDECVDPSRIPFRVSADIGAPYFAPALSSAVIAGYVARAREYVAEAQTTPGVPSDAAIETYIRTQLAGVVAGGRADANLGYASVFSQSQLIIDTGNFIADANAQGFSLAPAGRWFAGVVDDFVGRDAEARVVNSDCPEGDIWCERDDAPAPCPIPVLCCPIPGVLCVKDTPIKCDQVNKIGHEYVFVPCKPKDNDDVPFRNSTDPNDKVGPGGEGGFVDGVAPLPYVVSFENLATASGDAFEVTITDQLDVTKYDLATFSLGPVSFGDRFVAVPPGLKTFSTEVDLRPGANILVGIEAALDTDTGVVTWKFTTLDPETHEFPEDPEDGFLPPNVTSPEGEGAVLFTVNLKPGFGLGTTVCNDARIVFDFNAPIDTPEFCNTIGAPEDCENCIDDDGDGLVDRGDPDCAAPANGAGLGVGDAKVGKIVDKCAKAIRKAGTKLASNRLKQLGACEKAVADCVQLKPGDAACLAKAQGKCTKAKTALPGAESKLTAAIVTACGEPTVATATLLAAVGLGFDGETASCQDKNLDPVATVADVAECVRRQHACAAERMLGTTVPRARELLVLGGFDTADFGCLAATANGGGSAVTAEKRKAIRKCDGAIQKAAAKLLAGRTKAGQACAAAEFGCAQTKPNDPACVGKAGATCMKAVAALPKLQATFASAIAKSCGAPLDAADLLAPEGLGAAGLAATCARLGVPSLASVADVSACLERQLACRADQLLESTTPRLDELLGLGGVSLP